LETKPQEGTGWPSAPLSRGPDGPALDKQGTTLNVAPVSAKYLSFVKSSVRKIRPAFAGKCMAVAVACVDSAAEPVRVWRRFSFPNKVCHESFFRDEIPPFSALSLSFENHNHSSISLLHPFGPS
jgi:hypothetical protein